MLQQYQNLYEELRHFYQLLYIYDIEKYSPVDLKSLAIRLQGQLNLDEKEKRIHEELIAKSKYNVEQRLNQKRKKEDLKKQKKGKDISNVSKQEKQPNRSMKKQEKIVEVKKKVQEELEDDFIDESCILNEAIDEPIYKEIKSINGKIYDGKHLIQLNVAHPQSKLEKSVLFELTSEIEESTITPQTLKQLSLSTNSSQVALIIAGRAETLKLADRDYNTLGLKYLRSNKVITKSNYRTDSSSFSMAFTQ